MCTLLPADVTSFVNTLSLDWGTSVPTGLRSADFWVARFTAVLLAPNTSSYTFSASVDDQIRVLVDGEAVLTAGGSRSFVVSLSRGYHDLEVHYLEAAWFASMRLLWDAGVPGTVSRQWVTHLPW